MITKWTSMFMMFEFNNLTLYIFEINLTRELGCWLMRNQYVVNKTVRNKPATFFNLTSNEKGRR